MSKRTIASRLGAAAATALLLAGCTAAGGGAEGSPSPSASPTASVIAQPDPNHPDPCALITPQDIADRGGIPEMNPGRFVASLSGDGRSICRWTTASEDSSVPRMQLVLNWENADLAAQRALADAVGAGTQDLSFEGIPGGEFMTAAYSAYGGRTIAFSSGEYFVQLSLTWPAAGAPDVQAQLMYFAGLVASRL